MERTQGQPKEYKTIPFVGFKLDEEQGIVEHIVSVFGIEDLGGDIVHPGAFTKTIQERGARIRVLDSHRRSSCLDVLGKVLSLKEIPRDKLPAEILQEYPKATGGLWARTQFLLDTPEGKGVFSRIKSGAVDEFSFGYDTLDEDYSDDEKGHEVRNLRTLRLWEYSPVIFGMNPGTTVTGVKSEDEDDAPVSKGEGEEEKPAPDVTENTIRMRVRDPGAFQEGSFRTVTIGDKDNGISAVMGRLKGETTMTIQSYVFDKSKWSVEKARKWIADHKKVLVIVVEEKVEPGGPDKCVCPKCGEKEDKKRGVPCKEMKCPKCGTMMVADTGDEDSTPSTEQAVVAALNLITIEQAQIEIALAVGAGPAE